ncbi:AHH domain-containing protein [Novosphingobium sp. JCM 18896]|uniref:AHH domain-containing protein n=1 Tax=Novosphingobium sp. JCM 18896 TaxID=2989731 RepID=UPI0022216116|nr:AHH domain-containing protein [Novosphingobium sp. JCM 18896]MCW1428243.1 AHH domain-containing protein [Novosphingobium sp. JCM 18896]
MNQAQPALRCRLRFDAVNRSGSADHDPGLQRHHLLPRQLLSQRCFGRMFEAIGPARVGFDDFRANGMLLPCCDAAVLRMAMPLHRGPHHRYSRMVIERVGTIEASWSRERCGHGLERANEQALMRLGLVQRALRRRLLQGGRKTFALNRRDPFGSNGDFSELDAMAEMLWVSSFQPSRVASAALAS